MSQAEIAGGRIASANEVLSKGLRIPDFTLKSTDDKSIQTSEYRGNANLVLIFLDARRETAELLSKIAAQYQAIVDEDAEALAIARSSEEGVRLKKEQKLTFPVLIDSDGNIHRSFGALDKQGQPAAALYITDRFGEIFAAHRTREIAPLPDLSEIISTLEFVNIQCPECSPPEWPA